MAAPDDILALNPAISQADRALAAPSPARVQVDGRSLAALLAFAVDYGTLITFYDLYDRPNGDWSIFFRKDPSIALAVQLGLDLDDIQAGFDRTLADLDAATSGEGATRHATRALAAIERLAEVATGGESRGHGIDHALSALVRSDRRDLLAVPARALQLHLGGNDLAHAIARDRGDWLPRFADHAGTLAAMLVTALGQGRAATLAAFEDSLADARHPPQSGLYDAFATLFGHAQATINRFPARLAEFYRKDVLRQVRRTGEPDRVCLCFTPGKGIARVELPRGTRFDAGKDADGESIAYSLETALSVDAASVAALRTLRVTETAAAGALPALPAQVLSGIVTLADTAPRIATPFPLFGADSPGSDGTLTTTPASLGFAIASPTLLLAGGTRTITFGLTLTPASHAAAWERCVAIGDTVDMDPEAVFTALTQAAFGLRYSSAGDWASVESGYQVTPITAGDTRFALAFTLSPDAAPLTASAPEDMPGEMPVLVARLLQDAVALGTAPDAAIVYPYAIVTAMVLEALSVDVVVTGLADVTAASPNGAVDPSQPFAPFGSPPVQGATFSIAAPELFVKPVSAFTLSFDWVGLPVTTTGFRGYYQAYVVDADGRTVPPGSQYDDASFRAGLTLANPGWWSIAPSSDPYKLFTSTRQGTLQPAIQFTATVAPQVPPTYYDPALSTIDLVLSEPDTAFGDVLYAPNVMAASLRLTATASACAQQCGTEDSGASDPPLAEVNAAARRPLGHGWRRRVARAARRSGATLDDAAAAAIEQALAAHGGSTADLRASLTAAQEAAAYAPPRLLGLIQGTPDPAARNAALRGWLAEHGGAISAEGAAAVTRAHAFADAGAAIRSAADAATAEGSAAARDAMIGTVDRAAATIAAATGSDTSACVRKCLEKANILGFPNQPWQPQATRLAIDYTARAAAPVADGAPVEAVLFHLLPFDAVEAARWTAGACPLLAPIPLAGSLFIQLSDPAEDLTLLFRLAPPVQGWPEDTPRVGWAQARGAGGWAPLTPLRDTTNDLRNSGIVTLHIDPGSDEDGDAPWLRADVAGAVAAFPDLATLVTNAAMAEWVGPGGGAELGTPLTPGRITRPVSPIAGLGSVDQPLPSTGGAPLLAGKAFAGWLAERLRHKDRGIQDWDYATLTLAAFPSLWQVAVVPASRGGVAPAPGHVWIVPVPGPETPAIVDPTIPSSDAQMLDAIHAYLVARISPFIRLHVTNPPYLRLRVAAELIFADADSAEAYAARLEDELIRFLSPWPTPTLGPRPPDYYTTREIAHFIRNRPYVRAILKLQVTPAEGIVPQGWHYCTSATAHDIRGKTQQAARARPLTPAIGHAP
ncbi:baseplate J/gp47 family protein [Sphingomonas hengshuiensis]|uniref:hypothetical protein n=1 Tax=Sphingomonas hengshuiensis TaxID=1609977 RepID=UPI000A8C0727|nr:hypothetical protein [Sphingomonas hengshuiensis]